VNLALSPSGPSPMEVEMQSFLNLLGNDRELDIMMTLTRAMPEAPMDVPSANADVKELFGDPCADLESAPGKGQKKRPGATLPVGCNCKLPCSGRCFAALIVALSAAVVGLGAAAAALCFLESAPVKIEWVCEEEWRKAVFLTVPLAWVVCMVWRRSAARQLQRKRQQEKWRNSDQARVAALECLAELTRDAASADAAAIGTCIEVVKDFDKVQKIQVVGLQCLERQIRGSSTASRTAKSMIKASLLAMNNFPKSASVQRAAMSVCAVLAADHGPLFVDEGGIEAFTGTMARHQSSASIQILGCHVLSVVSHRAKTASVSASTIKFGLLGICTSSIGRAQKVTKKSSRGATSPESKEVLRQACQAILVVTNDASLRPHLAPYAPVLQAASERPCEDRDKDWLRKLAGFDAGVDTSPKISLAQLLSAVAQRAQEAVASGGNGTPRSEASVATPRRVSAKEARELEGRTRKWHGAD